MSNSKVIGSIEKQQRDKRGWLVGQFMNPPFWNDKVEIYYKTFPVGDPGDALHKHPVGTEYMVVVGGRARPRLGKEVFEIKQGDYLAIPANTVDQLVEVLEELTIIGVRTPSIPNDKQVIEEK